MISILDELGPQIKTIVNGYNISKHVLHVRGDDRGGLYRFKLKSSKSVVAKLWKLRDVKEDLKSFLHLSNGWREWKAHSYLYRKGLKVPEPLEFFIIKSDSGEKWECLIVEDLGNTQKSLVYLKDLVEKKAEIEIEKFENELIKSTKRILDLGLIDIDHQFNNFVVDEDGNIIRIDFECVRRYLFYYKKAERDYTQMLARFVIGHIYAVQPEIFRTEEFVKKLYKKVKLNTKQKEIIQRKVNFMLEQQYKSSGIRSDILLPD